MTKKFEGPPAGAEMPEEKERTLSGVLEEERREEISDLEEKLDELNDDLESSSATLRTIDLIRMEGGLEKYEAKVLREKWGLEDEIKKVEKRLEILESEGEEEKL